MCGEKPNSGHLLRVTSYIFPFYWSQETPLWGQKAACCSAVEWWKDTTVMDPNATERLASISIEKAVWLLQIWSFWGSEREGFFVAPDTYLELLAIQIASRTCKIVIARLKSLFLFHTLCLSFILVPRQGWHFLCLLFLTGQKWSSYTLTCDVIARTDKRTRRKARPEETVITLMSVPPDLLAERGFLN